MIVGFPPACLRELFRVSLSMNEKQSVPQTEQACYFNLFHLVLIKHVLHIGVV